MGTIFLLLFITLILIILDITKKINLMRPLFLLPILLLCCNVISISALLYQYTFHSFPSHIRAAAILIILLFLFYSWMRLNIIPVRNIQKTKIRLNLMIGGRFLAYSGLWAMITEFFYVIFLYPRLSRAGLSSGILTANSIYAAVIIFIMLFHGIIRMFLTSRRLSIIRRIVILMTMWIPVINIVVIVMACRLVNAEYDFACYKEDLRCTRSNSDICTTKYPLLMLHGVFFRDMKYFNYWGRIPKELMCYGARIHYGNQEAAGSIEGNACDIRKKIIELIEQTGCEKVNIIAHSKGGLDARYAISRLGMDKYVASLTTMNTPHRGCRFVDLVVKMPDFIYRLIARIFDATFRRYGDAHPDFYTATHQFTTQFSSDFNLRVPDSKKVYYQSYMSKMNHIFSDSLLALPYALIWLLEGANDGLVSLASAPWGNYRGLLTAKGRRGISHGDIIDLKREDYRGFDIVEAYVNIVADLKKMGY